MSNPRYFVVAEVQWPKPRQFPQPFDGGYLVFW